MTMSRVTLDRWFLNVGLLLLRGLGRDGDNSLVDKTVPVGRRGDTPPYVTSLRTSS